MFAFFTTKTGDFLLNEHSRGAAGRNRPLNAGTLLKESIPVPPIEAQALVSSHVYFERKIERIIERSIKLLEGIPHRSNNSSRNRKNRCPQGGRLMPGHHTEASFESAIEDYLITNAGYEKGNPLNFNQERCLDPSILIAFIQATQPDEWSYLQRNPERQSRRNPSG